MSRKRSSTFFTLDIHEAIVVKAALDGLLRELDRLPDGTKVQELIEIAKEVHPRLDKRLKQALGK